MIIISWFTSLQDDYCDDDRTSNDIHEVIEKTTALVGDNLVEIPNKVFVYFYSIILLLITYIILNMISIFIWFQISKIQLPYMVKDKSVNMKRLKLKIWNQIESSETSVCFIIPFHNYCCRLLDHIILYQY